ncbi:MAG: hypothetical protein M1813_008437 [Trichoglossum hirsutum]|nr:MAG: hypothetical protein M1813_008437 [Trichoglossum hirsutum]
MPPISSCVLDSILKSEPYERYRDLLSQFPGASRTFRLARDAGNAPIVAQSLTKLNRHLRRQNNGQAVVIPNTYTDNQSGPSPGSVVGIVLGSVFGFLFLLWLIWACFQSGGVTREEFIRERRPAYSRRAEQFVEIGRPPRRPERVIVRERRSSLVDSTSDSDVIIEETVGRRRGSRDRPQNGIRYINPDLPGGGDGHIEKVYGGRGSGSRRSRR